MTGVRWYLIVGLLVFLNYIGLHHSTGFSLVVASGGNSLMAMQGMFMAVTYFGFFGHKACGVLGP